jgi:hypothetical protein
VQGTAAHSCIGLNMCVETLKNNNISLDIDCMLSGYLGFGFLIQYI